MGFSTQPCLSRAAPYRSAILPSSWSPLGGIEPAAIPNIQHHRAASLQPASAPCGTTQIKAWYPAQESNLEQPVSKTGAYANSASGA